MQSLKWLLMLSLPLYVLDQATKWAVLRWLEPYKQIVVVPDFFYLVHVYNTGAAFSFMKGNNSFFLGIAAVALGALLCCWFFNLFTDLRTKLAMALLVSGIAGNLTDRILHGHVIDFLEFILPVYGPWPAFNVADSCICVATILLLWEVMPPLLRKKGVTE